MIQGKDYIGVGVGGMIFNQDGKVFLAKRGEQATNERFLWEFPGGKVNFGERLTDALRREFLEEYGMEIEIIKLLDVFDHILLEGQEHWISSTFIARHVAGVPKILEPQKCLEIGYFPLNLLPEPRSIISEDNLHAYLLKYDLLCSQWIQAYKDPK
jgi:8-oxo-dGTP diphosphatase